MTYDTVMFADPGVPGGVWHTLPLRLATGIGTLTPDSLRGSPRDRVGEGDRGGGQSCSGGKCGHTSWGIGGGGGGGGAKKAGDEGYRCYDSVTGGRGPLVVDCVARPLCSAKCVVRPVRQARPLVG